MEERAQSEFNMAVSYLNRMNALFYIADEAAMALDAYQWYHTLLALERELSTEMKPDELARFEKTVQGIAAGVSEWANQRTRNPNSNIDADLYLQLHQLEIDLRTVLKKAGLQNKMMDDAMKALR